VLLNGYVHVGQFRLLSVVGLVEQYSWFRWHQKEWARVVLLVCISFCM